MALTGKFQRNARHLKSEHLEAVARAADRVEHIESPVGGSATPPSIAHVQVLPVFVIGRTVEDAQPLMSHGYTLRVAGETHEIAWTQLIVGFPLRHIDGTDRAMRFMPAAVVGDSEHEVNPWRAQGMLYRMPDLKDGSPTAMVELFGLSPNLGC